MSIDSLHMTRYSRSYYCLEKVLNRRKFRYAKSCHEIKKAIVSSTKREGKVKTKLEGESGEGEAKGSEQCPCCVVYCWKIQPCGRCQTCSNYVRVCVCVSLDTIDDTTRYKEGLLQGVRLQLWLTERGHATATPTVNRSRGGQ